MAVRPPANTPAASAAPAASEPVTAESLGWQLRAALPPLRLHSVSLYDEQANVLWLSEGALGPDEHNLVLEAMDACTNDRSLPCYENGLEDGRVAIFLPVRAPQGDLVGIAMILADLKSVSDGILEKIVSPQVRTIMQKIAVLLRAGSKSPGAEPPAPIPVAVAPVVELTPDRRPTTAPAASPAVNGSAAPASVVAAAAKSATAPAAAKAVSNKKSAAPAAAADDEASLSPQAIDDILEFELFPDVAAAAPADRSPPTAAPAAPQATTIAWDESDAGLSLVSDQLAGGPQPEPAKAAPTAVTPLRSAAAAPVAKPAPAVVQAAPVATRIADTGSHTTQGRANGAPNGAARPPVAHAPVAHAAAASPAALGPVGGTGSAHTLEPPIPTVEPAPVVPANVPTLGAAAPAAAPAAQASAPAAGATSSSASTAGSGNSDALSTTAVSLALPQQPSAPAPATKSTNATTTTRALSGAAATTGTARALNNPSATASVPALNGSVTTTSRTLAFDPSNLILDVQPFSKLRAGGRMRRYEVLPRIPHRDANRAPAAMDGLALQRLLSWLGSNRSAWNLEPTSFSLNLSISTLEDPRFPQQVASCLKTNGIAPDNLGFEIAESLCTQNRALVERFISLCDKLGCFVVIDDFSFDSSVLPLLRSKALRLVKIDPKLTSIALRDKLSQAMVVAIVQAVKVLGIHCAAKRVESQASLQWLTAIGCDLAQGPALSQVLPIESLNMPQTPAATLEPPKAG
jgi:EAL domain-containing protein (putative c-di-GMP-specific phosphodiesterase class I)